MCSGRKQDAGAVADWMRKGRLMIRQAPWVQRSPRYSAGQVAPLSPDLEARPYPATRKMGACRPCRPRRLGVSEHFPGLPMITVFFSFILTIFHEHEIRRALAVLPVFGRLRGGPIGSLTFEDKPKVPSSKSRAWAKPG